MNRMFNSVKSRWPLVCLLMILITPLSFLRAQEQEEDVLTEVMLAKIRQVGSVRISPDGKLVAYILNVPRPIYSDDDGPSRSELHVVDRDGKSRPFITGQVNISAIEWTPDGGGISFLAKRGDDEHKALYVIPGDGGEARKVLEHETDIGGYSWGPDGREIAFTAKPKLDEEREKDEKHGFNAEIYEEDYLFTKVWIAAPDYEKPGPERDDEEKPRMLELEGSASALKWSPDGRRLAVALAPTPLVDDGYMMRRIHIVDVKSGESLLKLDTEGKLGQVAWSPDGKHIALVAGIDKHDPREGHLMVAAVDNPKTTDLLARYPGHIWSIAWQDNDTIMYLGYQGVWTTFAKIDIDGGGKKTLLPVG
ncbi:MAG: hypothetical protein V3S06_05105, partial [candidate division Zixibacteria bacterium]